MQYIIKKVIALIATVLAISILTFVCFSVIPGDAALSKLGVNATEDEIKNAREKLGLDDPLPVRYLSWLKGAVQGDFGESLSYDGIAVKDLIASRMPTTLLLALISFLMIMVVSIPLGLITQMRPDGIFDRVITVLNQIMMAVPSFFLGILITYFFGLVLRLFQPGSFVKPGENFWRSAAYLVFPALCVAIPKIAMTVKFLKGSIEDERKKDYVRTARSKGLSERSVLEKHVLKNAFIPVITFLGLIVVEILAGSIVAEQVFSVPGLGRLLVSSISGRDYPVVQSIVLYITTTVVLMNTIVDILYQLVDPRIEMK